jgi:hypothetical protein
MSERRRANRPDAVVRRPGGDRHGGFSATCWRNSVNHFLEAGPSSDWTATQFRARKAPKLGEDARPSLVRDVRMLFTAAFLVIRLPERLAFPAHVTQP